MSEEDYFPGTADDALARLMAGNERFVSGRARPGPSGPATELVAHQNPFATVLGCSDSRVPLELLFDVGFGDLFVIRVAGNVMLPAVMGSIQYAGVHLHTPLLMILGHEGCGAVKAALAALHEGAVQQSRIQVLLNLSGTERRWPDRTEPGDLLLSTLGSPPPAGWLRPDEGLILRLEER